MINAALEGAETATNGSDSITPLIRSIDRGLGLRRSVWLDLSGSSHLQQRSFSPDSGHGRHDTALWGRVGSGYGFLKFPDMWDDCVLSQSHATQNRVCLPFCELG